MYISVPGMQEEALKRSNQSAFKRKMLEDGGLKVDGWRLKTPIRAELDKEEEEGEPTDTRPRVHLLQVKETLSPGMPPLFLLPKGL